MSNRYTETTKEENERNPKEIRNVFYGFCGNRDFLKKNDFTRDRDLTLKILLYSFIVDASSGFSDSELSGFCSLCGLKIALLAGMKGRRRKRYIVGTA